MTANSHPSKPRSATPPSSRVGRPSPWRQQPKTTIRVPAVLADTLLELAHELDQGLTTPLVIQPQDHQIYAARKTSALDLQRLRVYRHQGHSVLRLEDLVAALAKGLEPAD